MYDFDETQLLTLDEMVLAFRSTLSGLSKLSKIDPPTEAEVEVIVVQGFDTIRKAQGATDLDEDYAGIDKDNFLDYCINTPEIMSWIEYFDQERNQNYYHSKTDGVTQWENPLNQHFDSQLQHSSM